AELEQPRIFHITVKVLELLDEIGVGEEPLALVERHRREVVAVVRLREAVEAEDVLDVDLGLEAHEHEVADEQPAPDAQDVARQAVVLGADAAVLDQRELGASEDLLPARVERLGLLAELGGAIEQAPPDDLVAAALERLVRRPGRRGRGGFAPY